MKLDSLKKVWDKVAKAFAGTPPVNSMYSDDVAYIQQKVREQTLYNIAGMDTRFVNCRKNVGLVIDPTTPDEIVAHAEDVFIAAAKERNIELTREQVVHYVPGHEPVISRVVTRAPKTW